MDRSQLRSLQLSGFRDPASFLRTLRELEPRIAASSLDPKIKQLRTNKLKKWREARQAALFCYGMSQRIGQPIYLNNDEAQDYDFIASWAVGDEQHFAPVQLKEVVPTNLNAKSSLEEVISSLTKYVNSEDLTVAIHLNRKIQFDPKTITVPPLNIAALWVFSSISEDGSEWALWGNFLEDPEGSSFAYPT
ncbi:MAG: hypothetical protein K0M66_02250 [Thiobacillus sp.]|nr:hypothetical protein [Thiobacillus sp.]